MRFVGPSFDATFSRTTSRLDTNLSRSIRGVFRNQFGLVGRNPAQRVTRNEGFRQIIVAVTTKLNGRRQIALSTQKGLAATWLNAGAAQ